jgi:predicted nucleic acid-binding protein
MSRVFFDTNLFIYWLEDRGEFARKVHALASRMREREDELITSTLTIGEVLVKPVKTNDTVLIAQYEKLLGDPAITVVPFDKACGRKYAQIRQDKGIKPPDAIQLACAAQANCNLFLTNDDQLTKKVIHGIDFIVTLEKALSII